MIEMCSSQGRDRKAHRNLVRKSQDKNKSLEGPKHRWEDNIEVAFEEIGFEDMNWIQVAWDCVLW